MLLSGPKTITILLLPLVCIFLFACSSAPPRPRADYILGNVTIVLTDPDEIWNRFGCEGRMELLPDGKYRIWAPMPQVSGDSHALEVLGHEMMHVIDRTHPVHRDSSSRVADTR